MIPAQFDYIAPESLDQPTRAAQRKRETRQLVAHEKLDFGAHAIRRPRFGCETRGVNVVTQCRKLVPADVAHGLGSSRDKANRD